MEYTVLWVDDDLSIVEAYQTLAEVKGIDLIHKENWAEGRKFLIEKFDEITAIILDANCKVDGNSPVQGNIFLGKVVSELQLLFGQKHNSIPWYILSAGTMSNFGPTVELVCADRNTEWGKGVYLKDDIEEEENPLFENICRVGQDKKQNIILHRHNEVFKYLGDTNYLSHDSRANMLHILSEFYYPENNFEVNSYANTMRHIIEDLFSHAVKIGIMPPAFKKSSNDDNTILTESQKFLCGKQPNHIGYRFKKVDENARYSIFDYNDGKVLEATLGFTQKHSHKNKPYSRELCLGMALSLCHIIRAYGQFVDTHSNIEEIQSYWETFEIKPKEEQVNISQKQTNKTMQEPIDYTVEGFVKETDGVLHIDDVCLPLRKKYQTPGQKFRIEKVIPNTQDNKDKYPYFAIAAGIKEID